MPACQQACLFAGAHLPPDAAVSPSLSVEKVVRRLAGAAGTVPFSFGTPKGISL